MIIGTGDIASVLPKRKDLLFFASGVSNSQENREAEYRKEYYLLLKQPRDAHIVYFGSLAMFYSDTRYTQHKHRMEATVKEKFEHYTILRLGNITWGKNPNTLINFFKTHPEAEIRDEYRYVIDKQEFLHWVDLIPDWNAEMNCPGRMLKVGDIVEEYCR